MRIYPKFHFLFIARIVLSLGEVRYFSPTFHWVIFLLIKIAQTWLGHTPIGMNPGSELPELGSCDFFSEKWEEGGFLCCRWVRIVTTGIGVLSPETLSQGERGSRLRKEQACSLLPPLPGSAVPVMFFEACPLSECDFQIIWCFHFLAVPTQYLNTRPCSTLGINSLASKLSIFILDKFSIDTQVT